jgi:hypothetical protein
VVNENYKTDRGYDSQGKKRAADYEIAINHLFHGA